MKVRATFLMCLVLGSVLASLANIQFVWSNPSTLYVPSPDYPTIQAAINAANPGDTIMVANGIYNENNLVITQNNLTLQGIDKTSTIIDGGNGDKKVIIVNADNIVLRDFTIRNAGDVYDAFGVFLNYSNNIYLSNNIFSGCYFPIRAHYCVNVTVTSSTFAGDTGYGSAGIYTVNCQIGLIEKNTFNTNHVGAFIRNFSANFIVRNNTFSSCIFDGVTIAASEHNVVIRNVFMSNDVAISLKYEGNNTVVGNTISNSVTAGVQIQTSPNNVLHHNNFLNNAKQVNMIDDSVNVWSTSGEITEGNYWSDYSDMDENKNGIGDTPYSIGTNNQDTRPLIGPFTEFTVTSQTGPRNVYVISNSAISGFSYNQVAKQINFQAQGVAGSVGICRVVFPTGLIDPTYVVYVNSQVRTYSFTPNSTHVAIYFSYTHENQPSNVVIVPEFPTLLALSFVLLLTLLIAVLKRKKKV